MIKLWEKIEPYLIGLFFVVLPWQMRYIILPSYHQGIFSEYASVSIYLTDLLIIILLLGWVIKLLFKYHKIIYGTPYIFWPLLSLIIWIWLSLWIASRSGLIIDYPAGIWVAGKFTLLFGFYLYLINQVKHWRTIVLPLALGIFIQGGIGIVQYLINHSIGLRLLDESVLNPAEPGIPVVVTYGIRHLRAHGLLPHANLLGGYLAIGLILLIPQLVRTKGWLNCWLWSVFAMGGAGLILSFSRSAWLVFAVSILILGLYIWRRMKLSQHKFLRNLFIALIIISGVAISQYQAIIPRVTLSQPIEQKSILDREQQLAEFNNVFAINPITGVGVNQYVAHLIKINDANSGWLYRRDLGGWVYQASDRAAYPQPVHNLVLLILAELGVVGLIIVGILLLGIGIVWWLGKSSQNSIERWAIGCGILGLILLGSIDHYLWDLQQGRLLVILVLALLVIWRLSVSYNKEDGRENY